MGMSLQEQLELEMTTTAKPNYQQVVVQQSVTMLAYMEKSTKNHSELTEIPGPTIWLGFSVHDLPILIGAAAGAVGLTIIILIAVIVWHCCRGSSNREKAYSVETLERGGVAKHVQPTIVHSQIPLGTANDMVVYLGDKPNKHFETQVLETLNNSTLRRSNSLPYNESENTVTKIKSNKTRPTSQPFSLNPEIKDVDIQANLSNGRKITQKTQCASYSALDEPGSYIDDSIDPNAISKSRSLPSWGKLRPLSTEDDLNELYAKVSFSKKRKNRMGNHCAAAIAMNKSVPNHTTSPPFIHKDTDSLVDNEAVVVYDERTSL